MRAEGKVNDTDLYEYLLRRFAGVPGVRVILERRKSDRPVDERERKERRTGNKTDRVDL